MFEYILGKLAVKKVDKWLGIQNSYIPKNI